MKFRKKPVVIEAFQFMGHDKSNVSDDVRALVSRLEAAEKVCTRVESEGGHGYPVHELVRAWRAIRAPKEGM